MAQVTVTINGKHKIVVEVPGPFRSIYDIKLANRQHGHHWFEPSTIRFFKSRVGDTTYGGRFFVSSEQFDYKSPRLYSVRVALDDGSVETVGDFQEYASRSGAVSRIKSILATH